MSVIGETGPPAHAAGSTPPVGKSLVARLLSPIADIHTGEETKALLLTLLMFLVLAAYYELKTAREVFILSEGGAEVKSYSSAGQAFLLLGLVPAYGAFASKVNRQRLVTWVTLFFAANVGLFAIAYGAHLPIGIAYFLWVGIFNVMVIAQFWALANDLFTPDQGKRLFPLIGVGSSLGAWVGSVRAGHLVSAQGPMRLLLGAGVILVVCALLASVVSRRAPRPASAPKSAATDDDKPLGKAGGFELIRKDRYLLLIALLTVLLNVVNTSGEYLLGRYVVEQAQALHGAGPAGADARQVFIGATYSRLFSMVNLMGFLLQMFVVSRVFKYLGVGKALYIHPIVALTGYGLFLTGPSLSLMTAVKVADNSLDYSLGNTTKQALWLPTSREAKYKAKQAVDSFFVRAGDVISAGIVFAGERLALAVPVFATITLVLAGAWLGTVALLNVALRRKTDETHVTGL
ncbi:ADP/ATP carrier protein family protein [Luteitalea pratensis]|uniref:ADP/ATP carrier protein family protein n=1 Tax=Luteitalea pratensis TaxID=1855912 RepID=A0A143PMK4_LUTPR|nr:Npt1/Npt2 family nucleotide transporter [Luteitalea pratensis]AMY08999.1 ADP/ATP carrier protein family protein [Luteitalea pratensis]